VLRAYVAPPLLEAWAAAAQREGARADEELTVEEVRLVWAEHGSQGDRLTAGIDCLAELDGELHTLTEYWTLSRPPGRQTTPASGECPECGAPIGSEHGLCRYCRVELPGPLQGWLLARMDEEIDWYEGPPGSVV
jgi:hypothetical protein